MSKLQKPSTLWEKIQQLFSNFVGLFFGLLDPDLDCESGSGSTTLTDTDSMNLNAVTQNGSIVYDTFFVPDTDFIQAKLKNFKFYEQVKLKISVNGLRIFNPLNCKCD